MPKKTLQTENANLARRVMELEAQLASTCAHASREVEKAGDLLMASAAVLTISALGGRVIVKPVAIRDGLSPATIAALKADLARSYDLATMTKPKA